jgi:molybdopterin biosynthesis enzyme
VINTGAKLPDTANAIIQIEDTQVHERHSTKTDGSDEKSIRIYTECTMNQDIRYMLQSTQSVNSRNYIIEILVLMLISVNLFWKKMFH